MMVQIEQVLCAAMSSAMSLLVNKIGGVSGFTRSLAALNKSKTVLVTPEPKGAFDSWLAQCMHATLLQKEAALRLQGFGEHTLHVHSKQPTWHAQAEFDLYKLGCNAVNCVNNQLGTLF